MFLLHLDNSSAVSSVGDSSNPAYNPIYLELDSTDVEPPTSSWVKCYLSLPAGYVCLKEAGGTGGSLIKFEGTTANYWRITPDDPGITVPIVGNEITVSVQNNLPTAFWIRANTVYGEVPVDDRSVNLKVVGEVEKV